MKLKKLFEIKVLEPAKGKPTEKSYRLDGYLNHPARYRFTNCWLISESDTCQRFVAVGREGGFEFTNGYCDYFLGEYEAWVIGEIDKSRINESDRFMPLTKSQPT